MSDFSRITNAAVGAIRANSHFEVALGQFHTTLEVGDWDAVEAYRLIAVSSLEAYMDEMTVWHRRRWA